MLSTYLMYLPVGEKIDPFLCKCLLQKQKYSVVTGFSINLATAS